MASIQTRRRSDGTVAYRVMFRIDRGQVSETFDDAKTANDFGKLVDRIGGQAARDLRTARTSTVRAESIEDWFERYLLSLSGVTAGTVAEYRRLANRTWMPHLGQLPVAALSKDHVIRWVGIQAKTITKRGTPTSAKTLKNAANLLSQVIAGAVEEGLRPSNPCRGIATPKGQREEIVFLTENEWTVIYDAVPEYWQPFVLTLVSTGMRWGEATALQWRDVDLNARQPVVRVSRAWKRGVSVRELGAPKTSRSRRVISLPPQLVEVLRPLEGKGEEYVFKGPMGGMVHHQMFHPRVWRKALAKADIGKKPRIHDLRHTHASWLIADGIPLPVIQRRLGHESITTTVDTYGHLADNAQEIAADSISRALAGSLPVLVEGDDDWPPAPHALMDSRTEPDVEGLDDLRPVGHDVGRQSADRG